MARLYGEPSGAKTRLGNSTNRHALDELRSMTSHRGSKYVRIPDAVECRTRALVPKNGPENAPKVKPDSGSHLQLLSRVRAASAMNAQERDARRTRKHRQSDRYIEDI